MSINELTIEERKDMGRYLTCSQRPCVQKTKIRMTDCREHKEGRIIII